MPKVSIVMAVYNEKDSLPEVLEKINKVDLGVEKEILIVDGRSTDGTIEILSQINNQNIKIVFEEKRNGKGAAIRLGFTKARGDIILIQDADLELDPSDHPNLLRPILENRCRVVYGSRFLKGRGKTNIISYLGNRFVTKVANILFGANLTDVETCYKVFRSEVIKDMEFLCNGFDFDAELTALILKKGLKILEVPITYNPRNKKEGKKLRWTVGITSLLAIIRIRFK